MIARIPASLRCIVIANAMIGSSGLSRMNVFPYSFERFSSRKLQLGIFPLANLIWSLLMPWNQGGLDKRSSGV
jgi:hypothetical protein